MADTGSQHSHFLPQAGQTVSLAQMVALSLRSALLKTWGHWLGTGPQSDATICGRPGTSLLTAPCTGRGGSCSYLAPFTQSRGGLDLDHYTNPWIRGGLSRGTREEEEDFTASVWECLGRREAAPPTQQG